MDIKLKEKKMVKIGDSYGFTVDMAYIKNGQLTQDKIYNLLITETMGESK